MVVSFILKIFSFASSPINEMISRIMIHETGMNSLKLNQVSKSIQCDVIYLPMHFADRRRESKIQAWD